MSRAPARFRQLDVARALKGARDAGIEPKRLEIDASGKIVLAFTEVAPVEVAVEDANPWDEAV
jgi:hypothetical protein